mmetsp:Transcript_28029/g.65798  ORF Transcript_28029/g.65798 Transcript_28029/m.65798 type:complete len:271 (+) Transcript_28029:1384-2196(+)
MFEDALGDGHLRKKEKQNSGDQTFRLMALSPFLHLFYPFTSLLLCWPAVDFCAFFCFGCRRLLFLFLPLFFREATGGSNSSGPEGSFSPSFSSVSCFNCRRTRIAASFWGDNKSQKIPDGFGARSETRMTRVGVTMISTGTSCCVSFQSSGMSSSSSITWQSCTVVTTGQVSASKFPCAERIPHSNSAKPSPFPTRAPVLGQTAVLPTTTKSTMYFSLRVTGVPYFTTPLLLVHSSVLTSEGSSFISMVEKKPVRNLGWGVNKIFPCCST